VRNNLPPEKRKPLLVKISPDLSAEQRKQVADVVMDKWVRENSCISCIFSVKLMDSSALTQLPLDQLNWLDPTSRRKGA
jgi:dihydroorotate dehydrogenase